ncbi:MAG: MFS transporter [Sphingobium sp.]|nr:MFS transporter [Sphingobium sp.]
MAGPISASTNSVTRLLNHAPMSGLQIRAIALSVALNALDGFDVLAMTFVAPDISRAWGLGPAALGVTLSAGLAGMAGGSLLLAPLGDRFGRRPLVLLCIAIMALGMGLTAMSRGIWDLCLWRVVTGFGIGGMVAAINAVAAEFSNEKRRDFSVAVMAVGYPIGGLIGGFLVSEFLIEHGWQIVFIAGAIATALFLPLSMAFLPESLEYLEQQNSPSSRQKIAALLRKMGHPPVDMPEYSTPLSTKGGSYSELLGPNYRRVTLLLVVAYFLHIVTFYFFSGWLPKLVHDAGFTMPDAIRTSALMSLGGVLGGSALGWIAPRFGLARVVALSMAGTTIMLGCFALSKQLWLLQSTAFLAGVCVFGGIVGLFALLARAFPPELRVTGTGLAVGLGRGAAVVGPIMGGLLMAQGMSTAMTLAIIGLNASGAAIIIAMLNRQKP